MLPLDRCMGFNSLHNVLDFLKIEREEYSSVEGARGQEDRQFCVRESRDKVI